MRLPFAAVLTVVAFAATAPAAHAATVSVERGDSGIVYLSVLGGPEADALTASSPSPGTYAVTQAPGVPLSAKGPACAVAAPGRVNCSAAGLAGALLSGGDGDDRLEVWGDVGQGAWLFGGNGADDLTAGPGADRVDGGAGSDVLRTRDGRTDALYCGTDADSVDADDGDTVAADCEQRIPGPAAPAPAGPTPGPLPAPLPVPVPATSPAPVDISTAPVQLSHGAVPLRVSCSAATSCRGRIVIRLLPRRAGHRAVAAGARRPVIARRGYRVRAGHAKSLRVHISRRGRIRVLERRKARCSVSVSTVAADGTTQVRRRTVTIEAGGGR